MNIIETVVTGIFSIIAGSAGLGLLIPSYADWRSYKHIDEPTDDERKQCNRAKSRCVSSLVLIVICFLCLALTIYLPNNIDPPVDAFGGESTVNIELPDSPMDEEIRYVENQSYANGIYIGYYDTINKCPEGTGVMLFDNGDTYEGEWSQGKKHGHGIMTYYNRDVYDGDWANDMKHGHGRYTWYNGGSYDGDYENGKRNGMGTYKNWTGSIYNNEIWTGEYYGEHKDNVFDGYGKFTITNGDVFEGIFKDGRAWDGVYTKNGVEIEIRNGTQV